MNNNISFSKNKTLVDLFSEQVERTPDNVAVEFEGERIDYKTLNIQITRMASHLRSRGIKKGMLVGILLERSPKLLVSLMAVLKAGAVYLPIDPTYPSDRINFMLSDSGVKFLITEKSFDSKTNGNYITIPSREFWSDLLADDEIYIEDVAHSDLAYVLYTSGSTGKPKGVQVEHGNLTNFLLSMQKEPGISSSDILLAVTTISFDIAALELFLPLISGATIVLANSETASSGTELIHLIRSKQISIMQATPATWYMLLDSGWTNKLPLKVLCGGETLPKDLAERLIGKVSEIWNMYGPTETTIWSCIKRITNAADINIGRPINNTTIYILDKNHNRQPAGEIGEIFIGGKGVARGYLNRPELNREKFISNPFIDSDTPIYQTGDLGYATPNGEIICLGRIDDQVKIRGYRIELSEVENVLKEIPEIQQAVVLAKNDQEENKRLIAYVVTIEGFSKSATLAYLESKLPDYMIPSLIIPIDAVPLTANGKINKKSLPNPDDYLSSRISVPAQSKTEKLLVTIWKNVLNMDNIGIRDNFFEFGGNSLLAQKVVSLLKEKKIELPITKVYQYPTINQIAEFIEGKIIRKPQLRNTNNHKNKDIAIIAMSGRFPGANTIEELWNNLQNGEESIRFFNDDELDVSISKSLKQNPDYVKARGIISDVDKFDSSFFGLDGRSAEVMDPQQRIFLEICWEALESAGYSSKEYDGSIGVYAGCSYNSYYTKNVLSHSEIVENMGELLVMTLSDKDYLSSRVAYALNLKGPAVTVQSACSTSLLAISQAVSSIRNGQCDLALAGGISIKLPINKGHLYEEGSILSKNGHCKAFDEDANGTIFSDGGGVVLLKERKQAELDGDFIYAIIKGIGVNNDGNEKGSFTAPNSAGQAEAIQLALKDADVDPSTISYVETHGTGTLVGDPIEIEGLTMAFGDQKEKQFCAIGSVKSNIGHLDVAAGVVGLIKTCLSLNNKMIAPSINFKKPNPNIDFENSPFYVSDKLKHWEDQNSPRRAGVSSFGIGGTNVHVILEEHPTVQEEHKENQSDRPFQLITWSAKTEKSCDLYLEKLKHYWSHNPQIRIADLAYSLQRYKNDFNYRRFLIAKDRSDFFINSNILGTDPIQENCLIEKIDHLAFVFPGQGTQYKSMGKELYQKEDNFKNAVDECASLLNHELGEDIRQIIFSTNEDKLNNTYYTQPALFVMEYALAKLWISWGVSPTLFIGHSIGEFVAAHLAGILSLKDSLHLIVMRSRLMADLPKGSMLAIHADAAVIKALLPYKLSIAVVNSPNLCIAAGPLNLIEDFSQNLNELDIPTKLLNTSHAFHSSMMDSIIEPFLNIVKTVQLNLPKVPIISTVTGTWLKDAEAINPEYWANHLRHTVKFSTAIKTLIDEGNILALECGPGSSCTSFIRQQAKKKSVNPIATLESLKENSEHYSLLRALGRLWINGISIDWDAFYTIENRFKISTPSYAFERKSCWLPPILKKTEQTAPKIINNIKNSFENDQLVEMNISGATNNLDNQTHKSFEEDIRFAIKTPNNNFIAPRNETEQLIAKIWSQLLSLDTISINSNFFELGGHSLIAIRVVVMLKKETGVKLPVSTLFENPTVEELANILKHSIAKPAFL